METLSNLRSPFLQTFDPSLLTVLTSFLSVEHLIKIKALNKTLNKLLGDHSDIDALWKHQFLIEFYKDSYPDLPQI